MHMPGQDELFLIPADAKRQKNCPEGVDKGSAI